MTFDEYYDGERKSLREILEKRPWLTALNFLVSPGRKLTAEDCELFWSLLKDAQEDAFAAGREPGGHVAEPELACRTEKSPPEPVLEPGEYTIGQLMELCGPSVGCAGFGDDNLRHEWASVEDASRETGITPALIKWSSRQGRTVEGWNFTVYE